MDDARIVWKVVVSELFAENAYLVYLDGQPDCLIVDPGFDYQKIIEVISDLRLVPKAIVNTHGHADHIAGNEGCKRCWPDIPIVIGAKEADKLTNPELNLSATYGFGMTSPPADELLREGDRYENAGMQWDIYDTPGHSVGHIVLVCRQVQPYIVLGGDVLFQGSVGRSDFPDGSHQELIESITDKLLTLPDETVVLPGHGPPTTIGFERDNNPFLT